MLYCRCFAECLTRGALARCARQEKTVNPYTDADERDAFDWGYDEAHLILSERAEADDRWWGLS